MDDLVKPRSLARIPVPCATADAVQPQSPSSLRKVIIAGDEHAPLARGYIFRGIETEGCECRTTANSPAAIFRRQSVRCIFDYIQSVCARDFANSIQIAWF